MHDIRTIREDPDGFDAGLARRALPPASEKILTLDASRREAIAAREVAQAEINQASKEIGRAKATGDEATFARLRDMVSARKAELGLHEAAAREAEAARDAQLLALPNLPADDVPNGPDEAANIEMRRVGDPPVFDFTPKEHYALPAAASGMDFEAAAKLSGSRFMLLSGAMAHLHRALAQFMLDIHTEQNGLTETWVPVLVREDAMLGTGQLPKFGEDSYRAGQEHWLIPTAEVPLTNIVAGTVVEESYLPRRYVAHSQCFRSEAGAAGRDTAGMLRQHQFEKVEMVSIVHPDWGRAELDRMTACAEGILDRLGLPYRTVVLSTGDMGFAAARTHDVEVWLPGQNTYREISSISLCDDFQARRMNARFRPEGGGKPAFVHTLNGSGLAVGRTLIAVLENGQRSDGSVALPTALGPWIGGATGITAGGGLTEEIEPRSPLPPRNEVGGE